MIHPEGIDVQVRQVRELEAVLLPAELNEPDLKRKLRRNGTQRGHDALEAFRADHRERLRPLGIAHREQHARQPGNVIRMIVRKKHVVDRLGAPSALFQRDLRSLPAVDKNAAAVVANEQRCQISVRQRHHSAAAKQANV